MTTLIHAGGQRYLNRRPSASSLTSRYDDFLFAPICDEPSGMQLSVLSALARMNIDPWEEATRLAAMPEAIAESTLVSTLELIPNRCWERSETEVIAARLVRLLPQRSDGATIATTEIAAARAQRTNYWLVWMGIAIAISILSPHYHATTTGADDSKFTTAATAPIKNSTSAVPPLVSGESD